MNFNIQRAMPMKILKKGKILFAVLGFFPLFGGAQQSEENPGEKIQKLVFEPRISLQQIITNNAKLNTESTNGRVTQLSPGFLLLSNTSRLKGFADYSLDAISDSDGIKNNYVRNRLNANAIVEAIEQFAFIDISGSIATQPISAFGELANGSRVTANSTETRNFRVSPYFRGRYKESFDYEARYSLQDVRSSKKSLADSTIQDIGFKLENSLTGQALGWSTLANYQKYEFTSRRNITNATLRGALTYGFSPQLVLSSVVGAESTDQLSPSRETHSIVGLGAQWKLSDRTRINAFSERRYFGSAHNIMLEHRTARTVWRYTDIKDISNGIGNSSASLGNIFDLLNGFYMQIESDPVRRAQIVLAEIERLGQSKDTAVFQDFLRTTSTLQRAQNLSFALLGQRSTITLSVFHLDNRRLEGTLSLGDDFDDNTRIRQHGWSLLLNHRLDPNFSLFTNLSTQRSTGSAFGAKNQVRSIKLGMNRILSRRTSAGLQVTRSLSDKGTNPYGETSFTGIMTHRF